MSTTAPPRGMRTIGVVRSHYTSREQCPKQGPAEPTTSIIEIDPAWAEGLTGMRVGEYYWVMCLLAASDDPQLLVHPRGDATKPKRGLFTTRSPRRPAPISLTLVRLDELDGARLTVFGLDMLDGTPVLDIKPYVEGIDRPPDLKEGQ